MTEPTERLIPGHVRGLARYQPGKLIEDVLDEMGLTSAVKLASNENSLGPSPKALEAARAALSGLARYGDADSRRLREKISAKLGFPAARIVAGNGSSEIILTLCHTVLDRGLRAVMSRPSFTLYAKNTQAAGAEAVEVPLTKEFGHDLAAVRKNLDADARLVFLDNPLNPSGSYLQPREIEGLAADLPEACALVLDEAYADFARDPRPDYQKLMATGKVIVLRTFSKVMGLAGLRAAYALAPAPLAEALNKTRQPFNLNTLAQLGAMAALDDDEHVARTLAMTWESLDEYYDVLPRLGLTVRPTQANFLMAGLPAGLSADEVTKRMLRDGVIIRSLSSFGLPGHVRVNAGQKFEREALYKSLEKALA